MGSYLIPAAPSILEASAYLGPPEVDQSWEYVQGGVLFSDASRTDAECAALYAGFTPSGTTDEGYQVPLPTAYETHRQHVIDWMAAVDAGQTPTTAQTNHAIRDFMRGVILLVNTRLEDG